MRSRPADYRRKSGGGVDIVEECRRKTAALFGVPEKERVVFTSGATESLNMAFWGIRLTPGDSVAFTNLEHNSVLRPLHHLEREKGICLRRIDADARGIIDPSKIMAALDETTRAVVVNHGSNVLGTVQDLENIGEILNSRNVLFIVDASQTAGIVPIDAEKWGIDILAFTGHKKLYGLAGTGGLYVRPGLELRPVITGGTGVRSDLLTQPEEMPLRLEAGTGNLCGIAALSAGIDFITSRGMENIAGQCRHLREYCIARLAPVPGLRAYASDSGILPVLSFTLRGTAAQDVGLMLEESFGITVRTGLHCAPLVSLSTGVRETVRASFSCFTSESDIDSLADALRQIGKGTG